MIADCRPSKADQNDMIKERYHRELVAVVKIPSLPPCNCSKEAVTPAKKAAVCETTRECDTWLSCIQLIPGTHESIGTTNVTTNAYLP